MPTPHILDFDDSELADFDPARLNQALTDHPAVMLNHLRIAVSLDDWASNLERDETNLDEDFERGFVKALREVAAHLRQSDYVPGGAMLQGGE